MADSLNLASAQPRTLPDRIADHFIASIFTGALAPGERLPPDRELAQQLGVDRTSLRMAMQRLSHLGLVKAVRGSGVRVLDYRYHAGIDLLSALFSLPDLAVGGGLMLEILDDWLDAIPSAFGRAMKRMTPAAARQMDATMEQQLRILQTDGDLERMTALELELQDDLSRVIGSTTLMLVNNSSRMARWRTTRMYLETCDIAKKVAINRELLRKGLARNGADIDDLIAEYRNYLRDDTQAMRRRLEALPISPSFASPFSLSSNTPSQLPAVAQAPAKKSGRKSASSQRKRTK